MRPASLILKLLLAASIIVDLAALERAKSAPSDALLILLVALLSAQISLLAAWLAFGPPPLGGRLAVCCGGFLALQWAFAQVQLDSRAMTTGMLFTLLLVKIWLRSAADPAGRTPDPQAISRGRFSLQDLLLWTATAALGLAFRHHLQAMLLNYPTPLVIVQLASLFAALVTIWAILGQRLSLFCVAAPFALCLALVVTITRYYRLPAEFGWISALRLILECALLSGGLWVLRAAGLRWRPDGNADDPPTECQAPLASNPGSHGNERPLRESTL